MSKNKKNLDLRKEMQEFLVDDLLGGDDWKRSKRSWMLGTGAFRRGWRGFATSIGDSHRTIRKLAAGAFGREKSMPLPTGESDPATRFEFAQLMYGRTEAEVADLTKHTAKRFNLYFILSALFLSLGIILRHEGAGADLYGPLPYAWPFFPLFALLPLTMRMSVWNWQLRNRRLGTFWEWASQPREWLEVSHGGVHRSTINSALLILAATTLLAPTVAFAAGTAPGTASDWWKNHINSNDIYYSMMQMLIGGVGPIADTYTGPTSSALGAMAQSLNATLMLIGGMMLGWHTVVGTVSTAHEGKVLGQRWHQIWAPVRVSAGFVSVAPIAKGFCAAQLLVLQMAMWSLGLGNVVFTSYVDAVTGTSSDNKTAVVNVQMAQAVRTPEIIHDFLQKEVCYQTVAEFVEERAERGTTVAWLTRNIESLGPNAVAPPGGVEHVDKDGVHIWNYGAVCGKIVFDFTAETSEDGPMGGTKATEGGFFNPSSRNFLDLSNLWSNLTSYGPRVAAARKSAGATAAQEIERMRSTILVPVADSIVKAAAQKETATADLSAKVAEAKQAYTTAINGFVSGVFNAMDSKGWAKQLSETAHERGWASAGMFYVTIMRMQGMTYSLSNVSYSGVPMDLGMIPPDSELYDRLMGSSEGIQIGSLNQLAVVKQLEVPEGALSAGIANEDGVSGVRLLKAAFALLAETDPVNPVGSMIGFGHAILNIAYTILGVIIGAEIIAAFWGKTPAGWITGKAAGMASKLAMPDIIFALFDKLGFIAWMGVLIIIGTGILHAFLIPMMPYVYMLFAVMGNLILMLEGLAAASLWAFFHIRMDGQEFVDQKQSPGYQVMFNVLMRQPMTVFGYAMSMGLFGVMTWFLGKTFIPAAQAAGDGHAVGILGTIVMVVLASYLNYQIAVRSFALITQLPDRISRWWGANGEGLGEDNDSAKSTTLIAGQISHRVENNLAGLGQRRTPRGDGGPGGKDPKAGENASNKERE